MIFAMDTVYFGLYVLDSEAAAIALCPGLEVAEGDWQFFASDGSALEPDFSVPAYVDTKRLKYGNGIYSLRAGAGTMLQEMLHKVAVVHGLTEFQTAEDVKVLLPPNN